MKKVLFVVNPFSGKAQIKNELLDILNIFNKSGYETEVAVTQGRKDATEIVKTRGQEKDLIVCSGGDGTLNEVITGLNELENPPILGYIPAGSTNDFAVSLDLPTDMKASAQQIVDGQEQLLDIGLFCDTNCFIYIAAFGAFTEVSYTTSQDKKNMLGHQAYMIEAMKRILNLKTYNMQIVADGIEIDGEFIFGMITNSTSVGGIKGLIPENMEFDDGKFEVLLIRAPKTPIELSNIITSLFFKEEYNELVYKFKTSFIKITSEEDTDWVLDGEFGGTRKEITVRNLHNKIKILK